MNLIKSSQEVVLIEFLLIKVLSLFIKALLTRSCTTKVAESLLFRILLLQNFLATRAQIRINFASFLRLHKNVIFTFKIYLSISYLHLIFLYFIIKLIYQFLDLHLKFLLIQAFTEHITLRWGLIFATELIKIHFRLPLRSWKQGPLRFFVA